MQTTKQESKLRKMGLPIAILVLIAVLALPTPPDLSSAGHRMIGILIFSVIIRYRQRNGLH